MTRLEDLAVALVRMLALEMRREHARFNPLRQPSHFELDTAWRHVLDASRVPLGPDGRKAIDAMRNGWRTKTPIIAAIIAVGDALLAPSPTAADTAPDTGRDQDDTVPEGP